MALYRRKKTESQEAFLVTSENMRFLSDWVGGTSTWNHTERHVSWISRMGMQVASIGDYIIKSAADFFVAVPPDVFEEIYELVSE